MAFISFKEFVDLFKCLFEGLFIIPIEVMLVYYQLLNKVFLCKNGDLGT